MRNSKTDEEEMNGRGAPFIERFAEKIGVVAKASTVYGDPIVRNGTTVIPVAKVAYGFGGGAGGGSGNHGEHGEGSGGGGGVRVIPLGYIEIDDKGSNFRPIRDPATTVAMVVAGGLAAMFVFRGVSRLVRERSLDIES